MCFVCCCCGGGCCCWRRSGGYDGKGVFLPIDAQHPNHGHDNDEDDSSSSSGTYDEEDKHYVKYVYKKTPTTMVRLLVMIAPSLLNTETNT